MTAVWAVTGDQAVPTKATQPTAVETESLHDALAHAFTLYDVDQVPAARARFEALLPRAIAEGDAWAEAEAHRGLGRSAYFTGEYARARDELDRALEGFLLLSDVLGVARCTSHLGSLALVMGDRDDARALYNAALADLEPLGPLPEQADLYFNLEIVASSKEERRRYLVLGTDLSRRLALRTLEGLFLTSWGDFEYSEGHFDTAQDYLEQAMSLLEGAGARAQMSTTLNSLSRVLRAHGQPEAAIELTRRALAIQEELGNVEGAIQSLDHLADALSVLGDHREALALYARAAALAQKTGSPRRIDYIQGRTAEAYLRKGDPSRAAALLEDVLARSKAEDIKPVWLRQLSYAYSRLGRFTAALDAADRAVAAIRPSGRLDRLVPALHARARALAGLRRTDQAQADAREQMDILEQTRQRLSGRDFLKRGFAQQSERVFAQAVAILYASGAREEALAAAERARARAFLDLLAGRRDEPAAASAVPVAGRDLSSPAQAAAATPSEIAALSRSMDTTVLAYFVDEDATFAWVVKGQGVVASARIPVTRDELAARIARAGGSFATGGAKGRARGWRVDTRGGGILYGAARVRAELRGLYGLLVQPVRRHLPSHGERLTIVTHGPLARLPFAALPDARGVYLVEQATLHYVPAAAILKPTGGAEGSGAAPRPPLLVADPESFPSPRGAALARLPGTRREVQMSAAAAGGEAQVLLGREATEANVRRLMGAASLVHFATHGVVRDDAPFESFLALQPGRGGPEDDGRLTADEVYGLPLGAPLVVLSACSTARGPLTADGIVGLARAFFAAGAQSVVATLWDVPDDPTFRLMATFYENLHRARDRSTALRNAQLRILRLLRRGRISVSTAAGPVTLPEHPGLWAGFVLLGRP